MSVCHIMNMKMGDLANTSARSCPEGAWSPRGVRMCMEQHRVRGVSGCAWNSTESEMCLNLNGTQGILKCECVLEGVRVRGVSMMSPGCNMSGSTGGDQCGGSGVTYGGQG
jgi:hypothetical protein